MNNLKIFFAKNEKRFAVAALISAVSIFLIICATQIGRWSIWFDESFTHYLIKFNFFDIAKWTAADVHPPLFYWLLKIWGMIFGNSEVALRTFSTFFGAIAICLGFVLTRKLFGKKAGYLVLPLLALSPMLIHYSIEMRMYTLVTTIVFAQTLALLKARESQKRSWWIIYGVLMALGAWTQYFAVFVSVAQLIWLLFISRKNNTEIKKVWRHFFGFPSSGKINFRKTLFAKEGNLTQSIIVATIIFLPWIPFVIMQFLTVTSGGYWIPAVNFATLPDFISTIFTYKTAINLTGWGAAIAIIVLCLTAYLIINIVRENNKKNRENFSLVLFSSIIPVIILFTISLPPMRSYFIDRYLLASICMSLVLLVSIIAISRKKLVKITLYILTLTLLITGITEVIRVGNYNRYSNNISTAKDLMIEIREKNNGQKIPVIADTTWMFYDADAYRSDIMPVYFLDSQANGYYFGSEKMLQNAPEAIDNLREFIIEGDNRNFWYISTTGKAGELPNELKDFAKNIIKIDEINIEAPNGWNGSSQAVLYSVK